MNDPIEKLDAARDVVGTIARRHFRAEAAHLPPLSSNEELFPTKTRTYNLPESPKNRGKSKTGF